MLVPRRVAVRIEYLNPRGEWCVLDATDFAARVVQHEYDHLEGVLLVDRMSPAEKVRHKAALEELVDAYKRRRSKR